MWKLKNFFLLKDELKTPELDLLRHEVNPFKWMCHLIYWTLLWVFWMWPTPLHKAALFGTSRLLPVGRDTWNSTIVFTSTWSETLWNGCVTWSIGHCHGFFGCGQLHFTKLHFLDIQIIASQKGHLKLYNCFYLDMKWTTLKWMCNMIYWTLPWVLWMQSTPLHKAALFGHPDYRQSER